METIETLTTTDLGKTRPDNLTHTTTAAEHFSRFYAFSQDDVWTQDGYLVTAVQDDGVTHHLRKGRTLVRAKLAADHVFSFTPSAKAKYYLELI